MAHQPHIIPREKLDFGLDGDIPQYWFDNDPFKSRFFDALSTIFPEGERFFISCVRDYRDQVTDPQLLADIKDFMRQEGQHGMSGMAERVEQLGGTLTITSAPGEGTQIDALFPWTPRTLQRANTNKVAH